MPKDTTVLAADRYPHLAAEDPEGLSELIEAAAGSVDLEHVAHLGPGCPAAGFPGTARTSSVLCCKCFSVGSSEHAFTLDHVDDQARLTRQLRNAPTALVAAYALIRLYVRPGGIGESDVALRTRGTLAATLTTAVRQLPAASPPESTLAAAVQADRARAIAAVSQVVWDQLSSRYLSAVAVIVGHAEDPDPSEPTLAEFAAQHLRRFGDAPDEQIAGTADRIVDALWQLPAVAALNAEPARMVQLGLLGPPDPAVRGKWLAALSAVMPGVQFTDELDVIVAVVPQAAIPTLQHIGGAKLADAGPVQPDWVENGRPRPDLADTLRLVAGSPKHRPVTYDLNTDAGLWAGLRTAVGALT